MVDFPNLEEAIIGDDTGVFSTAAIRALAAGSLATGVDLGAVCGGISDGVLVETELDEATPPNDCEGGLEAPTTGTGDEEGPGEIPGEVASSCFPYPFTFPVGIS